MCIRDRPETLQGGKEIGIRQLIRTALRMRPGRIIIGEVRGAEAADFLNCLNTGHEGSLGSAHANSIRDMIGRLETMALMGRQMSEQVIRRQIAAGIEILVHLERDSSGRRRVQEIGEVTGIRQGEVQAVSYTHLEYADFYARKYAEVSKHQHKRALALTSRKFVRLVFGLLAKNQLYTGEKLDTEHNTESN